MTNTLHYFNISIVTLRHSSPGAKIRMEKQDLEIIEEMMTRDPELKHFMEEHRDYERRLEEFNRRPYLTAEETIERKRLQKLKLAGRDRIERILAKYRQKENAL